MHPKSYHCGSVLLASHPGAPITWTKINWLLESSENVRFGTNRQHKAISQVVIDECDPIAEPREQALGNFVNIIRVDQPQRARSAPELLGNGFACILPAWHGSQIGSGAVFTSSCMPVTRLHSISTFTSVRL